MSFESTILIKTKATYTHIRTDDVSNAPVIGDKNHSNNELPTETRIELVKINNGEYFDHFQYSFREAKMINLVNRQRERFLLTIEAIYCNQC